MEAMMASNDKLYPRLFSLLSAEFDASPCTVESHEAAKLAFTMKVIGTTDGVVWLHCEKCNSSPMWNTRRRGFEYAMRRAA
jgi:hypothetical protein